MRSLPLILLAVVSACGDDGGNATPVDAGRADARPDSGSPDAGTECDYTEAADATNDTSSGGTAEQTALTLSAKTTICGTFESNHFDGDITVDGDGFHVSSASEQDVLVRLKNAPVGEFVAVDIYAGPDFLQRIGGAEFYNDHGVGTVHLPAGTFEILAYVLDDEAATADVPYILELTADNPATRNPEVTTGGYTEANDGPNNTGNDVYQFPTSSTVQFTPSGTDAGEGNLTITPGTPTRITGTLADTAVDTIYKDRDTYIVELPGGVNELSTRLDWTGTANVDLLVFESTTLPWLYRFGRDNTTGPELQVFSLKPSTKYTLVVTAKTATTFPVTYNLSLAAEAY